MCMIKTFTQDDLVLYVYNELPYEAQTRLEQALKQDHELADQCSELLLAKVDLEKALHSPSQKVVNNILSYSRNLSL
jgi:anti-sigma factor RsiW